MDIPKDLVERAIQGESDALDEMWHRVLYLSNRFVATIARRKGIVDNAEIQDICGAMILGLVQWAASSPHLVREIENWPAFLCHTAGFRVCDFIRSRARKTDGRVSLDRPIDGPDSDTAMTLAALLSIPPAQVGSVGVEELMTALEQFLNTVPKEWAEVFRLMVRGEDYASIAAATGRPIGTVGVWIKRTREKARTFLRDWI